MVYGDSLNPSHPEPAHCWLYGERMGSFSINQKKEWKKNHQLYRWIVQIYILYILEF